MAQLNFKMSTIEEMSNKFDNNATENVLNDLEDLNIQFSMMCEDWQILNNEQREEQKKVYFEAQLAIHNLGAKYAKHLLDSNTNTEQQMEDYSEKSSDELEGAKAIETPHDEIAGIVPISQKRVLWTDLVNKEEQEELQRKEELQRNDEIQKQQELQHQRNALQRSYSHVTVHGEQYTNEIQYKDLQLMTKIIFNFQPIQTPSKEALNELMQVIDTVQKRAEHLKYDINNNKTLIACIHSKLDSISKQLFDWDLNNVEPDLNYMLQFLTKRVQTFSREEEILGNNVLQQMSQSKPRANQDREREPVAESSVQKRLKIARLACPQCKNDHFLYNCDEFRALPLKEKQELVDKSQICQNCFSPTHPTTWCLKGNCKKCNVRHNSLLCPNGYVNINQ